MNKRSIFTASFEESLNLEDDGFVKLQQEQHDKTAKFYKNGHASLWFRIRSFILSLIFPIGFNFFVLIVSMEFHESKTLTLPIARHESLTANVFLILLLIWLSFVVIGKWVKRSYLLPYRYQFHVFTFLVWFILEIDLVVFDILLANLSTVEIIAIYGIMMLATYMLFTIALAGLRKLMYDEISGDTFLNKIAKMISLYGMAILGIFSLDVSTSVKAVGFLLMWIFCNIVVVCVSAFIGLPYFLQAYYKWKFPEEYREWEEKSVEEWYGKKYLKKHKELLKNE